MPLQMLKKLRWTSRPAEVAVRVREWLQKDLQKKSTRNSEGYLYEWTGLYTAILVGCILVPILLGTVIARGFATELSETACLPSGEFAIPGSISIWNTDFILSITAGYGNFSFATAKAIDICWDLIVGRMGQFCLSWLAYRVFSAAIIYAMELDGVTCESYAAVAFQSGSIGCTWTMFLDFARGRYPRVAYGTAAYLAMLLTSIYIGLFPTLVSAITSYGPISGGLVSIRSVTAPFSEWQDLLYIIRDASRVGFPNDFLVTINHMADGQSEIRYSVPQSLSDEQSTNSTLSEPRYFRNLSSCQSATCLDIGEHAELYCESAAYCPRKGIRTLADMADLAPSRLCRDNGGIFNTMESTIWVNSTQFDLTGGLLDVIRVGRTCLSPQLSTLYPHADEQAVWAYDKNGLREIVSARELVDESLGTLAGTCNPSKDYQWGFSFLLLFIASLINAVIFIIMYTLHSYTYTHSRLGRPARQQPGIWKAIVDLSEVAGVRQHEEMLMWPNGKLEREMAGQKMTFRKMGEKEKDGEAQEDSWQASPLMGVEIELQPLRVEIPGTRSIE